MERQAGRKPDESVSTERLRRAKGSGCDGKTYRKTHLFSRWMLEHDANTQDGAHVFLHLSFFTLEASPFGKTLRKRAAGPCQNQAHQVG